MAVNLTKSSPTVSLEKKDVATGILRVNLNWVQNPGGKQSAWKTLRGKSSSIDLDLGCLLEMQNGEVGVIQALGNRFGGLHHSPYIMLDKDDRSGSSADGENLFINLEHFNEIKRILIYSFIYAGVPSWEKAQAVVTVHPVDGTPIEVKLDETRPGLGMCGIAMIENDGGNVRIQRIIQYFDGHERLDRAFGFGLNWVAGRK
jgi:tellurite resistance protein TerA